MLSNLKKNTGFHRLIIGFALLAAAPAFCALSAPSVVQAQTVKTGPVVLANATRSPITLTNFRYTDALGIVRTIQGSYELKSGFNGYLLNGADKIFATKIEYDLKTSDGETKNWSCASQGLDRNGNFSSSFTQENLNQHRKLLGKTPAKPAGPSDDQIAAAVTKSLIALVSHEASKPDPKDDVLDAIARGVAKTARNELLASALKDLLPQHAEAERSAILNLVILAFDGRLPRSHERVMQQLRGINPDLADASEIAEFLIRVSR